jgi:hypothetical protein
VKTPPLIILFFIITPFLFGQKNPLTEEAINKYFIENYDSLDPIEGIWDVNSVQEYYHYDTLFDVVKYSNVATIAVIKTDTLFETHDLSGEFQQVEFLTTDVTGVYMYRNYFEETKQYTSARAVISKQEIMEYTFDFPEEYVKIKLGKEYEPGTRVVNFLKWKKTFPLQ